MDIVIYSNKRRACKLIDRRIELREHWATIEDVRKYTSFRDINQEGIEELIEEMQITSPLEYANSIKWLLTELDNDYPTRGGDN